MRPIADQLPRTSARSRGLPVRTELGVSAERKRGSFLQRPLPKNAEAISERPHPSADWGLRRASCLPRAWSIQHRLRSGLSATSHLNIRGNYRQSHFESSELASGCPTVKSRVRPKEKSSHAEKGRRVETRQARSGTTRRAGTLAIRFSHNYLSAVTKVMFPTIKLVRPCSLQGRIFLCSRRDCVSTVSATVVGGVLLVAVSGVIMLQAVRAARKKS